jgi:hypothetical protein
VNLSPAALAQWVTLGEQAIGAGIRIAGIIAQLKAALAARGYATDTAELDALIEDAERRQALAEKEAQA